MPQLSGFTAEKLVASDPLTEVWRGHQDETGRLVAIRFFKSVRELGASQREELHDRFQQVAAAASAIDHANVVAVLAFDIRGGVQPYVVLEYVEGRTMSKILESNGPLPPSQVAGLGELIAHALSNGHDLDLAHGDVAPGNLLSTAEGTVKLTEFGITHLAESTYAERGSFLRSPAYHAPEVVDGGAATVASDQFSLGATLYALVTGVEPFARGSLAETARAVRDHRPAAPSHLRHGLTPDWDEVLARALRKDPANRFSSILEMAAAIGPLLHLDDSSAPHQPLSEADRAAAATDTVLLDRSSIPAVEAAVAAATTATSPPAEEAPRLRLRLLNGPGAGETFPIPGSVFIGRMRADVKIADDQASRRHARVEIGEDGAVHLTDLASSNGTWFHDQPISRIEIKAGDSFRIGTTDILLERIE